VVSSNEPLLFLSDDQKVIAASASFCRAFEIDPATVSGRRLSELGNGEWAMPKLASLLKATASGRAHIEAYEIDLKRPNQKTRHLVVNARTLDDGDIDHIRLLLAVTDVTDVRAGFSRTKCAGTSTTPITGSCRSPPCSGNSLRPAAAALSSVPI
jgi:PAS domain-containing protein